MTIAEYIAELRAIARAEGVVADDGYWSVAKWIASFSNGLTPLDAWDEERHPALRAM
jgi:hypothetical protein